MGYARFIDDIAIISENIELAEFKSIFTNLELTVSEVKKVQFLDLIEIDSTINCLKISLYIKKQIPFNMLKLNHVIQIIFSKISQSVFLLE